MKRRVTSVLVAAATVMCASVATIPGGVGIIGDLGISAGALTGVDYINSTGDYKTCSSYDKIASNTTKLTGGWYVVSGNVTLNNRLNITGDANIILMEGCTLTAKKGINVSNASRLNIYTQEGGSGTLYAGTVNGKTSTADSGRCGIGGTDATINIIGGQVYAVGGSGASGIMGSTIRLYWTNPEDLVYASSYSSAARLNSVFVDLKNKKAYNTGSQSASSVNGVTLSAANAIDSSTTYLTNGTYVAAGNVTNNNRIVVEDNVNLILANNSVLKASEGITVGSGNRLTISGSGKLYAGTTNGSTTTAAKYNAGIGAENGTRAGDIIIEGGTVYANAGTNASAIGGNGSYVEIDGGNVYANAKTSGTGIGGSNSSVRLGWTNSSDSIYATSYNGSVNFSKTLYIDGTGENARTSNIDGQTLVTTSRVSSCKLTFETNGGDYISPYTVSYNSYITSLPTPTRRGYAFVGWYTDRALTRAFNYNTRITSSMTLYAKWSYDEYCRVTFNANGGRLIDGSTTGYTDIIYNNYAYEPADPTRAGYLFTGWYTDKNCYYLYNFNKKVTSNFTLYAGWIENKSYLTIKFNTMGGTSLPDMTIDYGKTLNTRGLGTPTKNGYVFDAWYYDRACTYQVDCYHDTFYEDTTLYAGWIATTPDYFTVTFNANGGAFGTGNTDDMENVPAGENALTYGPVFPTRAGYDFIGWYLDRNARNLYNGDGVYKAMTLYAGWEKTSPVYCTINYETNGGSFVMSRNVNYGDPIGASEVSYKDGYEFTGWFTDRSCRSLVNINTPLYNDITLYAGWSEIAPPVTKTYSVAYYIDDQYVYSETVNEGGYASGYGGAYDWKTRSGSSYNFSSPVYSDIELFAYSAVVPNNDYDYDYNNYNDDWWYAGSTFGNAGLIAAIAGGAVVIGGGVAAGVVISKKKKNGNKDDSDKK